MKKRHVVLEGVIKEFIKSSEPVSSRQLQEQLGIELSSATIRYYFKQLTQNGYLQKKHVSSGRIPSEKSLRNYWRSRLKKRTFAIGQFPDFDELAKEYGIVCEYNLYRNSHLKEVKNYKNRFLVLGFDDEELILPYNEKVEKYLGSLIDKPALDVAQHCMNVGLRGICGKIKSFIAEDFGLCNLEELLELGLEDTSWAKTNFTDIVKGKRLTYEKPGLKFDGKYLSYKFFVVHEPHKRAEVLLFGRLYRDYCAFLKNLEKE